MEAMKKGFFNCIDCDNINFLCSKKLYFFKRCLLNYLKVKCQDIFNLFLNTSS